MSDHPDFDEPYGNKGAPPDEKSTRRTLTVCFGILALAGIAFASIGRLGEPATNASTVGAGPMQTPPSGAAPR